MLVFLGLRLWDPAPLQAIRFFQFDLLQRAAPRDYMPLPVRTVLIDDASLARHGQWPWSRDLVAKLIGSLTEQGAATVVLDTVFAEPDRLSPATLAERWRADGVIGPQALAGVSLPDNDAVLARTLSKLRVVTGFALTGSPNAAEPATKAGLAFVGDADLDSLPRYPGAVPNLPQIEAAATGNGTFSIIADGDQVIRHLPLLARLRDTVYPSLALEALRVAQGADSIGIRDDPDGLRIRVGRLTVPVESDGSIWLRYATPTAQRALPAWRALAGEADVAGAIVLIGFSAAGLSDLRATPLNPFEPGVNVHAQGIEQILSGDWLRRPPTAPGAEALAAVLASGGIIALLSWAGIRWSAAAGALLLAGFAAAAWVGFTSYGVLLDAGFPGMTLAATFLVVAGITYRRTEQARRRIRNAFAQYLSPDLVSTLERDAGALELSGDARTLTFLFTDLEGFTRYAERVDPATLVRTLNGYLDGLCEIVMRHGGTVDKIVGDAVHAMFNAPLELPDHAARAVAAAREIAVFSRDYAERMRATGNPFGETRIGINTGVAIVGNFGGSLRFDYTAHGDAINTAARLEGANKHLGTMTCVAGSTVALCPGQRFRPIGTLVLSGKSEGVEAFEPVADDTDLDAYLAAHAALDHAPGDAERLFAACDGADPLVRLYRERLARGERGTRIVLDAK